MFRLVHFPPGDRDDLVPVWLWMASERVFALETALQIYDLFDTLPRRHHVLMPIAGAKRRIKLEVA